MKDYAADKIRNIALVGHGSSGKTSLAAAILFNGGVTSRLTKVDKGNTVTDFEPEEIDRKISISSAVCFVEWKDHKINIVDTPGYSNFLWDTRGRPPGRGRRRRPRRLRGRRRGRDREGLGDARGSRPAPALRHQQDGPRERQLRPGPRIRPAVLRPPGRPRPDPHRRGEELPRRRRSRRPARPMSSRRTRAASSRKRTSPPNLKDEAEKRSKELVEMIAESDEKLMEKYLEKGELSADEVRDGLKKAILGRQLFPVFAASALLNIGVQTLLDGIIELHAVPGRPRRDRRSRSTARTASSSPAPDAPFAALVFKTISDPYTGRITLMRVFSGKVNPDAIVTNPARETRREAGRPVLPPGQGAGPGRPGQGRRHRRHGQAQGHGDRRHALRQGLRDRHPDHQVPRAVDLLRHRAQDPGRRGQDLPGLAPDHGGGPDRPLRARPGHRPAPHLGERRAPRPDHHRKAQEALQRRRRPQAAQDLLQGDDQGPGRRPGPPQEADGRPRPVRRRLDQDGAPAPGQGFRVRGQDLRRGHPPELHPLGREGDAGRPQEGRPGRLPGRRFQGHPLRRVLPRRRFVGHRLQDRRLQGLQAGHEARPSRPSSSRS